MQARTLRRAILPITLLMLIPLFIYACVPQRITDLQLAHASRLPASALPRGDDLRDTLVAHRESVWKLTFSASAGWVGQVRQHELNSYFIVVRCDRPDDSLLGLGPYVGPIKIAAYGQGFEGFRPESSTLLYDLYLPETGQYSSKRDPNAPRPSYDLGRQRLTLCISIAGGSMMGAYARSNEVRVTINPNG